MNDSNPQNPSEASEDPSKSQRKRDMLALQSIGKQLLALSEGKLTKLQLPELLHESIHEARKLKSREAKRRHLQLIGKLMRTVDVDALLRTLERMDHQSPANLRQTQRLEDWRDRICNGEGAVIEEIISSYPVADRQQLRNLQRQAMRETVAQKAAAAKKKLFTYLKQLCA